MQNYIPCQEQMQSKGECTPSQLIPWASEILHEQGIDSPRLDAEILLSYILGSKRIKLYTHPNLLINEAEVLRFKKAIQRRKQREPLQYITNTTEFMSLDFYVDKRVLIPRPETELLVEEVINRSRMLSQVSKTVIVDIGTGSGNIAVTLATKISNARVFAVDVSPDALEVAKINAKRHRVSDKITFLCGNIFDPFEGSGFDIQADFIVSNPPYVASSEFDSLQEEVRDYEPYTALISGRNGLQMYKSIIATMDVWIKQGGFILMEVGETQALRVGRMLRETHKFGKIEYLKDYQSIDRIVIAQMEGTSG